ncbi:MAG TPA: ABC transporter permease subunit [Acidimicrobiales bacterium]|nr:ABC transporter permease subunit [Acidimicrobiales bacterium]
MSSRRSAVRKAPSRGREIRTALVGAAFLGPAVLLLGALLVYPIVFTLVRSLYDRAGTAFVGLDNYADMASSAQTLTAIRNTAVWVVVAPSVVTAMGLIFAVLSERVRWATAFKVVVFMPMAISFLAAGVIFRLVYEHDPKRGVANAVVTGVVDAFREPGPYPGARPRDTELLRPQGSDGSAAAAAEAYATAATFSLGSTVQMGLVGLRPDVVPADAQAAELPAAVDDRIAGVVFLDFAAGGGGRPNQVDPAERGLPGARVEALGPGGEVESSATTDRQGRFVLADLNPGDYRIRLAESTFRQPFGGVRWLGPGLVTPAIIGSYVWIWAGFAMVVIAAGLAAIPRDVLEAARVDGAGEWQVFRRVTVPLLRPVLLVVFVTLVINVLKVFDLVFVIPPGSVQDDANVIALEMWRVSFGGARDEGLGSALAVLLFALVVPAMVFNLRRFRQEA